MKKLFISQPMAGKSNEEIKAERERAIENAKRVLNDDVEVVDSFFENCLEGEHSEKIKHVPLLYLGESIKKLAEAEVAYFSRGFYAARGCRIELNIAEAYGLETIIEEECVCRHFVPFEEEQCDCSKVCDCEVGQSADE